MLFVELARTSEALAATRSRKNKVAILAELINALTAESKSRDVELVAATAWLSGEVRERRLGIGWASLRATPAPHQTPSLQIAEVAATFTQLDELAGAGSKAQRSDLLGTLFSRATEDEQRFLRGLLSGGLRQGALKALMIEAVAAVAKVPLADLRRAVMLARGDLAALTPQVIDHGTASLSAITLAVGQPIAPMLAKSATTVTEAMSKMHAVTIEAKLDGARIQVHRDGEQVAIYTRSLDDITARLPEVVEFTRTLTADRIILDGEAIALREDGRPQPFQVTASRFGSKTSVTTITPIFFDVLHLDGTDLSSAPTAERITALESVIGEDNRVARSVPPDAAAGESFYQAVLAKGHEGVVVKALDAPYEPGRRADAWVKVKPVRTLDLVVLAVEWGSGRRVGKLSNIHLGARNDEPAAKSEFVMIGKTFKGMTDAMLAWQTQRFAELAETPIEDWVVRLRPEQVVEIAFDGVQRSTRYPGGVALRFARVLRYRDDKAAEQADTISAVRELLL